MISVCTMLIEARCINRWNLLILSMVNIYLKNTERSSQLNVEIFSKFQTFYFFLSLLYKYWFYLGPVHKWNLPIFISLCLLPYELTYNQYNGTFSCKWKWGIYWTSNFCKRYWGITLINPNSRNKSDYTDLVYFL